MKHAKLPLLAIAALAFTLTAIAQPRMNERYSSEPGRDLERISVTGKIEKIEGQRALLKTDQGEMITVHLGPEHYWQEKGYQLHSGVDATVDGWGDLYDEDGGFIFAGAIYGDGFHFEFSGSDGYPRWADREDDWDGWRPSWDDFYFYYMGPPPPHFYWGPPPPDWRWHHGRPHERHHPRGDRPRHPGPPPRPHRGW
jgi:hypothetical protein